MHALRMSLACLVVMLVGTVLSAGAAAPPAKGQVPGYYRMMLGDFEIIALNDGILPLDVKKLLTNTTPARVDPTALAKVQGAAIVPAALALPLVAT